MRKAICLILPVFLLTGLVFSIGVTTDFGLIKSELNKLGFKVGSISIQKGDFYLVRIIGYKPNKTYEKAVRLKGRFTPFVARVKVAKTSKGQRKLIFLKQDFERAGFYFMPQAHFNFDLHNWRIFFKFSDLAVDLQILNKTITTDHKANVYLKCTIKNLGTRNFASPPDVKAHLFVMVNRGYSWKSIPGCSHFIDRLNAGGKRSFYCSYTFPGYAVDISDREVDYGECKDIYTLHLNVTPHAPDYSWPSYVDSKKSNNHDAKRVTVIVSCPW